MKFRTQESEPIMALFFFNSLNRTSEKGFNPIADIDGYENHNNAHKG